jgi:hypothetical protein
MEIATEKTTKALVTHQRTSRCGVFEARMSMAIALKQDLTSIQSALSKLCNDRVCLRKLKLVRCWTRRTRPCKHTS